jgi:hypothetical protein
LVDVRNKVEPVPGGYERDPVYKTWLSDLYSAQMNDNHYAAPPEEYFKVDHRMVVKTGGVYECEPDSEGRHGDTFTSGMLAQHALLGTGSGFTVETAAMVRMQKQRAGRPVFKPRNWRRA